MSADEPDWLGAYDPPYLVHGPAAGTASQALPVVIASPHSGRLYCEAFRDQSRLDPMTLRRSEDSFVEEIFGVAESLGVPLIHARFPRAFLDVNREPYELDPAMFAEPLPAYANTRSPRVAAGLGTVARVVANGEEIYAGPLPLSEALARVRHLYRPYHQALAELVRATQARFGVCLLLDGHSMPSLRFQRMARAPGRGVQGAATDVVLGDFYGYACAPEIVARAEASLADLGYRVARNAPYAGGFTTRHYGQPRQGVHALQVEIDRRLYMDEAAIEPKPTGLARLRADMAEMVQAAAGLLTMARAAE